MEGSGADGEHDGRWREGKRKRKGGRASGKLLRWCLRCCRRCGWGSFLRQPQRSWSGVAAETFLPCIVDQNRKETSRYEQPLPMDFGHHNCRDYYVSPHFAPTTIATTLTLTDRSPFYRSPFARHESFDELEKRCRSPASSRPKFPLLRLPLELRQQIFKYLLPRTIEHTDPNPLANHARNFSAVKKRGARGMVIPQARDPAQKIPSHVMWQRGNINLLSVSRQVHDECAELLYGTNTFLLFITYAGITFRYSWLLPSGLAPNRRFNFLDLLPSKYLILIKRLVINVDHVDSYTSMIKFNVGGSGLTHGLRKQVQRLVNALQQCSPCDAIQDLTLTSEADSRDTPCEERRLGRITIRVSNGNAFLDQIKSDAIRQREGGIRAAKDIQEMLQPFTQLRGVREVAITGAITETFARNLEQQMRSTEQPLKQTNHEYSHDPDLDKPHQLCCYGNDL